MIKRSITDDNSFRSVMKALTFRIIVIITNGIIVFTITGKSDVTFGVIAVTTISSTMLYFFHERLWNQINWGREKGASE